MISGSHTFLFDGGEFQPGAGLPLTDRGFRYGMSVFETVAIRSAAALLSGEHLARLEETAAAAKFRPPEGWLETTRALLEHPPIEEGVARIHLTAGDRDGGVARVALLFEEMPIPTDLSTARALTVEFTPALPFGKTGNYWPHFLARPATGEEPILCTPRNLLLGGAMANLFLVLDDALFTPRRPVRCGVVRDWIHAKEAGLTRDDLARARAAFLTNSRFGLCNLTAIDGRELPGDPLVATIWERYRREVLRAG